MQNDSYKQEYTSEFVSRWDRLIGLDSRAAGEGGFFERLLRQHGWLEVLKLRALLEKLPQLREIIQQLGRLQRAESGESVAETLLVPVRRVAEERRSVRTPRRSMRGRCAAGCAPRVTTRCSR